MAFFGSDWDDGNDWDKKIGPMSSWLEDEDDFCYDLDEYKDPGEKGADDNE